MERHDLSMHRCASFHRILKFKKKGVPVDLTGYTAKCQVRECPDGGKLLTEMTAVISPQSGRVDLFISAADSEKFESGAYAWDVRLSSPANIVEYYLGGKFMVLPSVTE